MCTFIVTFMPLDQMDGVILFYACLCVPPDGVLSVYLPVNFELAYKIGSIQDVVFVFGTGTS